YRENMSAEEVASYRNQFAKVGYDAAGRFLAIMHQFGEEAGIRLKIGGIEGKFVALDVEEKLLNEQKSTLAQRRYYGRFYATAVCSWLNTVKADPDFGDLVPILYTT